MKKIYTSLGCPKCNSSDISVSLEYCNENIKYNNDNGNAIKIMERQKIYNCKCNSCEHSYSVNHGNEKYILFEKPYQINCSTDVNLLAVYETESGFNHGYKICSITNSPYDDVDNNEVRYLMFIEGEEYPIMLSKETKDNVINDPSKARSLVINNVRKRHS